MFVFLVSVAAILPTGEVDSSYEVKPVKVFEVKGIPRFRDGFSDSYRSRDCAFVGTDLFLCLRPVGTGIKGGEVLSVSPRTGKISHLPIPQPAGFDPPKDPDFVRFSDETIWVNNKGDFFVRWNICGNGDHGLALFSKDSSKLITQRSNLLLHHNSRAIANTNGEWFFLSWNGAIRIYRHDEKLNLIELGSHNGLGRHTYGVLDARFSSTNILHLIYADVGELNRAHLRTVEFDVTKKTWTERKTVAHLEAFVSSVSPMVLQLEDDSLHYLWRATIQDNPLQGVHYLGGQNNKPIHISKSTECKAIAQGNNIILAYTLEQARDKVFFRVIHSGVVGPETFLQLPDDTQSSRLRSDHMVLGSAGNDRLFFVNTMDIGKFHELEIRQIPK